MARAFEQSYGKGLVIEYIDVTGPRFQDFEEIHPFIDLEGEVIPVITLDREPLWIGGISFPKLVQELGRRGILDQLKKDK